MLAIELCVPGTDGRLGGPEPWPAGAAAFMEATRARGLLVGKGGLYGNVLRIAPPLSVTDDEIGRARSRSITAGRGRRASVTSEERGMTTLIAQRHGRRRRPAPRRPTC